MSEFRDFPHQVWTVKSAKFFKVPVLGKCQKCETEFLPKPFHKWTYDEEGTFIDGEYTCQIRFCGGTCYMYYQLEDGKWRPLRTFTEGVLPIRTSEWTHKPTDKAKLGENDRTVFHNGEKIGRTYMYTAGSSRGEWRWESSSKNGCEKTMELALKAIKEAASPKRD